MFFLLAICFAIILFISFFILKKDIFAPPVIVGIMYCLGAICALYNYSDWNLNNYNVKTVIILLSGMISFLLGSFIAYSIFFNKNTVKNVDMTNKTKIKDKIISLPAFFCIGCLFIFIITILFRVEDIIKIGKMYSSDGNFFKMIGTYRSIVSYSTEGIQYDSPFLLKQLDKIVTVVAYFFSYITVRNIFNKDKLKHNIIFIVYILLFFIYSIISGGRMPILKLLAAILFFCYMCSLGKFGELNSAIVKKYIKVGIRCLLVLILTFPLLHVVMGRNRSFTPDYYITMYAGGPLKLIDLYVEDPRVTSTFWGQETFYGINQLIGKLGAKDHEYIKHLEFRTYNGLFLGNIYTPFRRYYADFGISGVIALSFIYSFLMSIFYLKTKKAVLLNKNKDKWIMSYGLIVYTLFLYSIDDQFYTVVCSTNYIVLYIILFVFYKMFKYRFQNDKE